MKFSAVLLSTLAAVAVAQSTQKEPESSFTPEQLECLEQAGSDLARKAECLGAPGPTEEMANATTQCAMECEQGDGSPEATEMYAACQQKCIVDGFFVSTLGADGTNAVPTKAPSGSASAAPSSTMATQTSTAEDGSVETTTSTPSATEEDGAESSGTSDSAESASASASGDSAASGLQMATGFTGFAALFAALFAL